MLNLIKNEFQKLMKKPKMTIVIIILCLMTAGACTISYFSATMSRPEKRIIQNNKTIEILKRDAEKNSNEKVNIDSTIKEIEAENKQLENEVNRKTYDWRQDVKNQITTLKTQKSNNNGIMKDVSLSSNDQNDIDTQIKVLQYQLDNNIKPEKDYDINAFKAYGNINSFFSAAIIAIIIAVITSDIVSGENSPATIKLLVTKPVSRTKILLSKFITVVLASVVLITGVKLLGFLIMGILYQFGNPQYPVAIYTKYAADIARIQQTGMGVKAVKDSLIIVGRGSIMIKSIFYYMLFITTCVSFCFMNSTLLKNSTSSMSLNMILLIILSMLNGINQAEVQNTVFKILHRLMPFNFMSFSSANDVVTGAITMKLGYTMVNVPFAVIILIAWIALCYGISNYVFNKRDILA